MSSIEPQYPQLGRRLREERERRHITQAFVAERIGLPRSAVSNIEKGKQRLFVHTLLQYAAALEMNPTELIGDLKAPDQPEVRLFNVTTDTADAINQHEAAFIRALVEQGGQGTS